MDGFQFLFFLNYLYLLLFLTGVLFAWRALVFIRILFLKCGVVSGARAGLVHEMR